jgi:hypothetical protein
MWLAYGERGISSEAIVTRLTGIGVGHYDNGDHPLDMGDFKRCELLLREVSEARERFNEMRDVSPQWDALVEHWQEIVNLAQSQDPEFFTPRRDLFDKIPEARQRIWELLDSIRR